MAAEGVRRGGEHNNQPKERRAGSTGHQTQRTPTAVRAMAAATGEARGLVVAYAAVRAEATAAAATTTMTAAEMSVEAAAMVTAEAAMVAAKAAANSTAMAATMTVAAAMATACDGCVEKNRVTNAAAAAVTPALTTVVKAAAR